MVSSGFLMLVLGLNISLKYVAHTSNTSISSPTISPFLFLQIVVLGWKLVLVEKKTHRVWLHMPFQTQRCPFTQNINLVQKRIKSRITHQGNKEKDSSILHILPNLVNLQGDDQLHGTTDISSVRKAEVNRPDLTVTTWNQFVEPGFLPHESRHSFFL